MQDVTRARGQEGANATIFSAAGLVVPFQDTVRSLLSTLSTETSSRAGQRTPAHVHDGCFVIRELNFSLGAVCTEAGVSVDSSELAVAAPPSPGKSYKTSLASSLQMGSHRSSAICRCSRGGFRRGACTKPNCSASISLASRACSGPEPP